VAPGPATERISAHFKLRLRGGLLFNVRSGRGLWSREAGQELPIASLTKMMTALVVAAHTRPDARVLITRQAIDFSGSGVGLLPLGVESIVQFSLLVCHVADDGEAKSLAFQSLHDCEDHHRQISQPERAVNGKRSAGDWNPPEDESDDQRQDEVREEDEKAVLRVPLNVAVVLLHQKRHNSEKEEVRQRQHQ